MDNLAHTMAAGVVSAALLPETTRYFRRRTFLAAAVVANLPDLDFLMIVMGREFYNFQHRGLTHSLFGLLFMFPACILIFNRIMKPALSAPSDKGGLGKHEKYFFTGVQLLFTHFFLDYLTTYGTMFLYPFSMARFSWPLMFIVDPLFWVVTGAGFFWLCFAKLRTRKEVLIPAWSCLAAVLGLWVFEASYRVKSEKVFRAQTGDGTGTKSEILTYPGPGAPYFWLLAERLEEGSEIHYRQAGISWLTGKEEQAPFFWQEPVPSQYVHEKFCREEGYTPAAYDAWMRYARWASPLVCGPFQAGGEEGCRCLSLKYSLVALNAVGYGAWWVNKKGDKHYFLPSDSAEKLLGFYRMFLPVPEI